MLTKENLKFGGRYNWKGQDERLIYVGTHVYPGDRRTWFQFEKIGEPGVVWSEVLESDLPSFEETAQAVRTSSRSKAVRLKAVRSGSNRAPKRPGENRQEYRARIFKEG
jgi:hypothetical protein